MNKAALFKITNKFENFQQQVPPETLIKTIGQFVRDLPTSDVDAACIEIFGDLNDLRAAKLKQAVQYYLNGTKDGFLKYKTASGEIFYFLSDIQLIVRGRYV